MEKTKRAERDGRASEFYVTIVKGLLRLSITLRADA